MSLLMTQYLRITNIHDDITTKLKELAKLQLKIYKEEMGMSSNRYHFSRADYVEIDDVGFIECWEYNNRDPNEILETISFDSDILNGQPEKYRERLAALASIDKQKEDIIQAQLRAKRVAQLEMELAQLKGE